MSDIVNCEGMGEDGFYNSLPTGRVDKALQGANFIHINLFDHFYIFLESFSPNLGLTVKRHG